MTAVLILRVSSRSMVEWAEWAECSKHGRQLDFTRRPWVAVVMWGARGAADARLRGYEERGRKGTVRF